LSERSVIVHVKQQADFCVSNSFIDGFRARSRAREWKGEYILALRRGGWQAKNFGVCYPRNGVVLSRSDAWIGCGCNSALLIGAA
jgi:hypothetical protein